MEEKLLLLGDQAVALGAIHAGITGVYAYPGTPSTEITEYIQTSELATLRGVHSRWCTNEKTAMEAALGVSYVGKRALVCMKHVGLNVAADAFVNSAVTGTNGGLVVLVADDPSMHSSQNEQDSRFYGKFAFTPMLEPSSQQEAYDMMSYAFDLSEQHKLPVLMRITTRMAHSRAVISPGRIREQNELGFPDDAAHWVLLPVNARRCYGELLGQQPALEALAAESSYNSYTDGPNRKTGVIACGIGYNYLMENFPAGCDFPVLKLSQYPLPKTLVRRMAETCDEILVLEDGQPFVEEQLRGVLPTAVRIRGRLSNDVPRTGELTPDNVKQALGLESAPGFAPSEHVTPRPPALCSGCGHRDTYDALNRVVREYKDYRVFSDIGCYTLGALPPFRAIHSGHHRPAGRGQFERQHHRRDFRQPDHGDDRRPGLRGDEQARSDLPRSRGRSGPRARGGSAAEKYGRDHRHPARRDRIPGRLGHHPAPRMHPDPQTAPQGSPTKQNDQILKPMKLDIILSGVGGQGILSIAAIIGEAALEEKLHIKQAEVHGMSQRGGDVQSNLRISSEPIRSDLIARGGADLILSLEPMEALRYLPYLSDTGWIVTNAAPFVNIPNYPQVDDLLADLKRLPRVILLDVDALAKENNVPRAANVVLLGAASPILGIGIEKIEDGIRRFFGRKGDDVVAMNLKALACGREAAEHIMRKHL